MSSLCLLLTEIWWLALYQVSALGFKEQNTLTLTQTITEFIISHYRMSKFKQTPGIVQPFASMMSPSTQVLSVSSCLPSVSWLCPGAGSLHGWTIVVTTLGIMYTYDPIWGFPGGAGGKESACQCRRHKRCGFDPWVGKVPSRRAWQPTLVFLPGESHAQRSLAGYGP